MGSKRVVTAALVYVALSGRLSSSSSREGAAVSEAESARLRRRRQGERWPERAPESLREAASVTASTARFVYAETLGKWRLRDIAFGINHYMRVQIMKPAFTIVRDESTKSFLLFIRGAVSTKERLTAAAAAEVPFRHSVLQDGRESNLVAGHAHCGMVAAARWISDQAIPCLSKAVEQFPDYGIKIIGHSMGASIASILTYMLRENEKFSSASCIAFGPAACMTWNLAESSKDFVTTVVNKNDLVPSFGKTSAANLRTKVMASSWVPELQEKIQKTRVFGFVNRSVSFMKSHIPFISDPRTNVSDADMFLPHIPMDEFKLSAHIRAIVKKHTLDEFKLSAHMHTIVKKHSALSCWSFVELYRQTLEPFVNPIQGTAVLMSTYVGADLVNSEKLAAGKRASCFTEELNRNRSDAEEPEKEDKAADQEHMEQLLGLIPLSPTTFQEPQQLYPPGRIMHMVVLPAPGVPSTSEQDHQDEVVAIYETPRSMYGKIRLDNSMISDHYMPRYIETMEMLVEKFAEDNNTETVDQLG